jgi:hypothetical protein
MHNAMTTNAIVRDIHGQPGFFGAERGARPTGQPHVGGALGRLERAPPVAATIPAPPCDTCRLARRCAVRREACAAYRYYVQADYPHARIIEPRLGKDIKPLKKFRD